MSYNQQQQQQQQQLSGAFPYATVASTPTTPLYGSYTQHPAPSYSHGQPLPQSQAHNFGAVVQQTPHYQTVNSTASLNQGSQYIQQPHQNYSSAYVAHQTLPSSSVQTSFPYSSAPPPYTQQPYSAPSPPMYHSVQATPSYAVHSQLPTSHLGHNQAGQGSSHPPIQPYPYATVTSSSPAVQPSFAFTPQTPMRSQVDHVNDVNTVVEKSPATGEAPKDTEQDIGTFAMKAALYLGSLFAPSSGNVNEADQAEALRQQVKKEEQDRMALEASQAEKRRQDQEQADRKVAEEKAQKEQQARESAAAEKRRQDQEQAARRVAEEHKIKQQVAQAEAARKAAEEEKINQQRALEAARAAKVCQDQHQAALLEEQKMKQVRDAAKKAEEAAAAQKLERERAEVAQRAHADRVPYNTQPMTVAASGMEPFQLSSDDFARIALAQMGLSKPAKTAGNNKASQKEKPKKDKPAKDPAAKKNQPPKNTAEVTYTSSTKLTDCKYFLLGSCNKGDACHFRHSAEARSCGKPCFKWQKGKCDDADCGYRHEVLACSPEPHATASSPAPRATPPSSSAPRPLPVSPTPAAVVSHQSTRPVAFFWDIENCAIPSSCTAFKIVDRLRAKILTKARTEMHFWCFCRVETLSRPIKHSLHLANVHTIDTSGDNKPGAADRLIQQNIDRFASTCQGPAVVVLISGDIDFVQKLSDLRYRRQYDTILVHNAVAKRELKETVTSCIAWKDLCTEAATATAAPQPKQAVPKQPKNAEKKKEAKDQKVAGSSGKVAQQPKPPEHCCAACDATFAQLSSLKQHRDSKRHWQCRKCKAQFGTRDALKDHEDAKDHVTFACTVCKNFFELDRALEQHQTATKHWQCPICLRKFNDGKSLDNHQRKTGHIDSDDEMESDDDDSD